MSRVSKVHRLPDLRSVYPRSSGNNNNLDNQPVLGEVWGVTLAQVYNSRLWRDWYLGWGSCSATHEEKSWIQNSPAITSSWTTLLGAPHVWRHTLRLQDCRTEQNRRALKHKNKVKTKQPMNGRKVELVVLLSCSFVLTMELNKTLFCCCLVCEGGPGQAVTLLVWLTDLITTHGIKY